MGAATAAFCQHRGPHSHLHANGQLLAGREPHGRGVPKGSSSTNRVQLSRWQRGTPSANKNGRGSHAHTGSEMAEICVPRADALPVLWWGGAMPSNGSWHVVDEGSAVKGIPKVSGEGEW